MNHQQAIQALDIGIKEIKFSTILPRKGLKDVLENIHNRVFIFQLDAWNEPDEATILLQPGNGIIWVQEDPADDSPYQMKLREFVENNLCLKGSCGHRSDAECNQSLFNILKRYKELNHDRIQP